MMQKDSFYLCGVEPLKSQAMRCDTSRASATAEPAASCGTSSIFHNKLQTETANCHHDEKTELLTTCCSAADTTNHSGQVLMQRIEGNKNEYSRASPTRIRVGY